MSLPPPAAAFFPLFYLPLLAFFFLVLAEEMELSHRKCCPPPLGEQDGPVFCLLAGWEGGREGEGGQAGGKGGAALPPPRAIAGPCRAAALAQSGQRTGASRGRAQFFLLLFPWLGCQHSRLRPQRGLLNLERGRAAEGPRLPGCSHLSSPEPAPPRSPSQGRP